MAAEGEVYRLAFPPKTKPHISTGIAFPAATAYHVANTFHASKVYVIVSSSISKTDNFTVLQKALGDKIVGVRKGIKPHTPWDDVLDIIKDLKEKQADLIVTLGAGSLTDGAKVISFALANNATREDDLERLTAVAKTPDLKPCETPVINIPTSLSGGEFSPFAGATDKRTNHKKSFAHPSMGADLIILDPALSISTPARIWLSTGIRAVDHCVEGLCSTHPKASAETDRGFAAGLKLLVPNLLITKENWDDEEARLNEFLGVVEAMGAIGHGVPMGGSHGIGHQLGPLGVGHGETSCIMLPAILKYNYKYGDERVKQNQRKVLDILWAEPAVEKVLTARGLSKETADGGDVLDAVITELGMPRSLKDVGVGRDALDALAENCLKDRCLPTNPVPLTEKKQVLEVLEMVVGDDKGSS
ncbi:iron-containing alcohol dehydrogenase-like protein [Coleophoma cylindrospora]|uniref:Iron-containing alcohol dehydrogenase-like protein n=1 Tax=Coleophoma cylindrospora TaxID=1849047 RepID=A0A3D8QH43_9HELO|nr:iron-containing alcohol dehydrogenase-like protein [Coleophoma cylindrospora]